MVLNVRATLVDPNRPLISDETYFWRLLPSTGLADFIDRTLQLFMSNQQDRICIESHTLGVDRLIERYVAPWAVDVTNALAQHMVERGKATKRVYDEFVSDLANQKSTYYWVTDTVGAATPRRTDARWALSVSSDRWTRSISLNPPIRGPADMPYWWCLKNCCFYAKPSPLRTSTRSTTRNRQTRLWPRSPTRRHRSWDALSYQRSVRWSEPQDPPSAGKTRLTEDTARGSPTTNRNN